MNTSVPAIIIVSYGVIHKDSQHFKEEAEEEIRSRYPEAELLWASAMRSSLYPTDNQDDSFLTVNSALHQLNEKGIERVVVLPLYVVYGEAYKSLEDEIATSLPLNHLKTYKMVSPLLHEARDADVVSKALLTSLPEEDECPDKILFMGHGCEHEAGNAAYQDVDDIIDRVYPGARLALLADDSFERLLAEWGDAQGPDEHVLLRPFLFTIGKHSLRDLAGEEPHSWKSRLEKIGYICHPELIPLSNLPDIQQLLWTHLDNAYSKMLQT